MTKSQILAKAILNGLLFLGVGLFLASFQNIQWHADVESPWRLFIIMIVSGVFVLWGFFYCLNNFHLAVRLAGREESKAAETNLCVFIVSVRLAAVSAGLLLLAWQPEVVVHTLEKAISFFHFGREFFDSIVSGGYGRAAGLAVSGVAGLFYPFGLCAWIFYLLAGAPRILRSQFRILQSLPFQSNPGEPNE